VSDVADTTESVEDFSARARSWLQVALPSWKDDPLDDVTLQNRIFDGGFGGLAFPAEYGGAGLTLAHHKAFYDAADDLARQVPGKYWVSIGMVAPLLLERASEDLKKKFLPQILRGDIVCIQLLSEPRGGSDLAGVTTRLTGDGDRYILDGSKMWSTNAYLADYGLCLARSNWDLPKHQGMSMILVPLAHGEGVTVRRTRMADGRLGDVCEEFFDGVTLPATNLIGREGDGWSVAQTLMAHERNQTSGVGFGYLGGGDNKVMVTDRTALAAELVTTARNRSVLDRHGQELADVYVDSLVTRLTSARIMRGQILGTHEGPWGSAGKLLGSEGGHRAARARLAALGADALVWDGDEVEVNNAGTSWLLARASTIGGGTSEIQRNIISERLLGLPREPSFDKDIPYSDVVRNATKF
jgi:alkylation response protein AidB-like acyl-CoA dehydrogenase